MENMKDTVVTLKKNMEEFKINMTISNEGSIIILQRNKLTKRK